MAHARESIRKAIITACTGLTTTGSNVGGWNIHAIDATDLPWLSVKVTGEALSDSIENEFGDYEVRQLSVSIEARARALADLDDTLDDICAEVETAVMGDSSLAALIKDVQLVGTSFELDGEGEKPVGLATMEWIIDYRVNSTAPTSPVQ